MSWQSRALRSFSAQSASCCDEVFDLLAGGFSQGLGAAEIDGIGLHQFGIELVLADDLAEPVADLGATVVAVAIGMVGRKLLRLSGGRSRFGR